MDQLVCVQPGQFKYESAGIPVAAPGHAVINITRIGICGTDYHAYEGTQPFFNYPRILGHELAGVIYSLHEESAFFQPGDLVTILPYLPCGYCIACRRGFPNCCANIQVYGVHRDGGMAEYMSVPVHLLVHGRGLNADQLALVEPLAIGAHAIRRASVAAGEFVLVVGAGPIGMAAMEFAVLAGARVMVMDMNSIRLNFCRQKFQSAYIINPGEDDPLEKLEAITNRDMPTVVIDATGNLEAINGSFQFLAHSGRYILVGLQRGEIHFSHPEFHKREAQLMSSRNATMDDFEYVIRTINSKLVDPYSYITHRVSFPHLKDGFAEWMKPESRVMKGIVEME